VRKRPGASSTDARISQPDPSTAAIGLEWNPRCLEFHRLKRTVRTASITQVRQPIYRRSVARWKN
jgi:hypothetical protein